MQLRLIPCLLLLLLCCPGTSGAEESEPYKIGDSVRLRAHTHGIPLHEKRGEVSVIARLDPGTSVEIVGGGTAPYRHWFRVRQRRGSSERTGWIIATYFDGLASDAAPEAASASAGHVVIGTWNLEHFDIGKKRGFPEKEDIFDDRTDDDLKMIADIILKKLDASLLMLQEIGGETLEDDDGGTHQVSALLNKLVGILGGKWAYELTEGGGRIRMAMLYDAQRIRINEIWEWDFHNRRVRDWNPYKKRYSIKGSFDRDPLAAHVSLLGKGGVKRYNDLTVIGVHLASEQWRVKNHDYAMRRIRDELDESRKNDELGGESEEDVLIMGDFNANMFDRRVEKFFREMNWNNDGWKMLVTGNYPATRLTSWPPRQARSQIDYIIASWGAAPSKGLYGAELRDDSATVHDYLIGEAGGGLEFRKHISDHLPVTVRVGLELDND